MRKLCLFCHHFYFLSGTQGYSEETPGSSGEIGCQKTDNWDEYIAGEKELRKCMIQAETCKDFRVSDDAKELGYLDDER